MNGLNSLNKTFKIKYPTPLQRTHMATLIIYVDHKDGVHITKNRYGPTGKVKTKDLIDIVCYMLGEHTLNIKLFQEEMIEESLKPAIYKVLREYKVLEGEENDKI